MGKLLHQRIEKNFGIRLNRAAFIWGNILPDFRPSFLARPHYLENNAAYIQKQIQNLLNKKQQAEPMGGSYSKNLGVICHYYADFFCFAHSPAFPRNLTLHLKYEEDLYRYFLENYAAFSETGAGVKAEQGEVDAGFVYGRFTRLHAEYLGQPPSYQNDLTHCIRACVKAAALLAATPKPAVAEEPLERAGLSVHMV